MQRGWPKYSCLKISTWSNIGCLSKVIFVDILLRLARSTVSLITWYHRSNFGTKRDNLSTRVNQMSKINCLTDRNLRISRSLVIFNTDQMICRSARSEDFRELWKHVRSGRSRTRKWIKWARACPSGLGAAIWLDSVPFPDHVSIVSSPFRYAG